MATNKLALVTGANRGLGMGFVKVLQEKGFEVFACTRRIKDQKDEANLHWIELDVLDDASISAAYEILKKAEGGLDVLVNNAGVNKETVTGGDKELVSKLGQLDRDKLMEMFAINAISPLLMVQKFTPLMRADPCWVINISSCRASYMDEFGNPEGNYGYRASKAALNMLTFCSTWDLPQNIRTFAVHPGWIKTDMNPQGTDDPYKQALKIWGITDRWSESLNGRFLRFSGERYPY